MTCCALLHSFAKVPSLTVCSSMMCHPLPTMSLSMHVQSNQYMAYATYVHVLGMVNRRGQQEFVASVAFIKYFWASLCCFLKSWCYLHVDTKIWWFYTYNNNTHDNYCCMWYITICDFVYMYKISQEGNPPTHCHSVCGWVPLILHLAQVTKCTSNICHVNTCTYSIGLPNSQSSHRMRDIPEHAHSISENPLLFFVSFKSSSGNKEGSDGRKTIPCSTRFVNRV